MGKEPYDAIVAYQNGNHTPEVYLDEKLNSIEGISDTYFGYGKKRELQLKVADEHDTEVTHALIEVAVKQYAQRALDWVKDN